MSESMSFYSVQCFSQKESDSTFQILYMREKIGHTFTCNVFIVMTIYMVDSH